MSGRSLMMALSALWAAALMLGGCSGSSDGGGGPEPITGTVLVAPQDLSHTGGQVTCTATLTGGPAAATVTALVTGGGLNDAVPMALAGGSYQAAYALSGNFGIADVVYTLTVVATDGDGNDSTVGQGTATVTSPPAPPGVEPPFPD